MVLSWDRMECLLQIRDKLTQEMPEFKYLHEDERLADGLGLHLQ